MNALIVIVALSLAGYLAFSKRLRGSANWNATVTPLASIMGSGFLVSAPLLAGVVGNWAVICMACLLLLAYAVGSAIRFNIRYFEPIENEERGHVQHVALLSRIVLVVAYFISVTYYLKLLAAFLLSSFDVTHPLAANVITTVLLVIIGGIGMWRGLKTLELVEKYAVAFNLGMIGALILSLLIYNTQLVVAGTWHLAGISSQVDWRDMRVLLGLLIVVQGFETSRYLGSAHSAEQRILTMRRAQLISAGIYLLFIGLATVLFHADIGADVTAIISMVKPVAVILPVLIAAAAIGSQFSAAVADNEGAGGLVEEITHHRLPIRYVYFLILVGTTFLTWEANVNQIIAYASRAFALFYMFQCVVAGMLAWRMKSLPRRGMRLLLFAVLSVVCLLVFVLGIPAE